MENPSVKRNARSVVLVGAGNVATHLGKALAAIGHRILQVYSRSPESSAKLSVALNCPHTCNIDEITPDADIYLFCVADDALEPLLKTFPHKSSLVVHTAGSISMNVITEAGFSDAGVFYPLQTFSRNIVIDFKGVPVFMEASKKGGSELLRNLAEGLGARVFEATSEQRLKLHIAAVFACNFTNHMYAVAKKIMDQNDMPFELLYPLMEETLRKAINADPAVVQTGPAARNDLNVLHRHIKCLDETPPLQKLYNFVSQNIIDNSAK